MGFRVKKGDRWRLNFYKYFLFKTQHIPTNTTKRYNPKNFYICIKPCKMNGMCFY